MDVAVERRETLLAIAVHVLGQGVTGLLDAGEERREERARGGTPFQHQRAGVAAPRIVRGGRQTGFHPLEVGQAMRVVPRRHPGIGGPALVVERVAPLEDLPVDARRAAEHLAPGVVDAPAVHERFRLRLVFPVVEPAADRKGQRGRHVDERIDAPIGSTGLEHEHRRRGIGRQPVAERRTGRAATDDDVVESPVHHGRRC